MSKKSGNRVIQPNYDSRKELYEYLRQLENGNGIFDYTVINNFNKDVWTNKMFKKYIKILYSTGLHNNLNIIPVSLSTNPEYLKIALSSASDNSVNILNGFNKNAWDADAVCILVDKIVNKKVINFIPNSLKGSSELLNTLFKNFIKCLKVRLRSKGFKEYSEMLIGGHYQLSRLIKLFKNFFNNKKIDKTINKYMSDFKQSLSVISNFPKNVFKTEIIDEYFIFIYLVFKKSPLCFKNLQSSDYFLKKILLFNQYDENDLDFFNCKAWKNLFKKEPNKQCIQEILSKIINSTPKRLPQGLVDFFQYKDNIDEYFLLLFEVLKKDESIFKQFSKNSCLLAKFLQNGLYGYINNFDKEAWSNKVVEEYGKILLELFENDSTLLKKIGSKLNVLRLLLKFKRTDLLNQINVDFFIPGNDDSNILKSFFELGLGTKGLWLSYESENVWTKEIIDKYFNQIMSFFIKNDLSFPKKIIKSPYILDKCFEFCRYDLLPIFDEEMWTKEFIKKHANQILIIISEEENIKHSPIGYCWNRMWNFLYNNPHVLEKCLELERYDLLNKFAKNAWTTEIIDKYFNQILSNYTNYIPFKIIDIPYVLDKCLCIGRYDLLNLFSKEAWTKEIIDKYLDVLLNLFENGGTNSSMPHGLISNEYWKSIVCHVSDAGIDSYLKAFPSSTGTDIPGRRTYKVRINELK